MKYIANIEKCLKIVIVKKSYSKKLERRTEWAKDHIEDIKAQYNLKGDNWKIYKVFIVNEHLVSKNVYEKK